MSAAPVAPTAEAPKAEEAAARVYYPELDGLRFVAFALVYLFHGGVAPLGMWIREWLSPVMEPARAARVGSAVSGAFRDNGWLGVQLFFLLSGFLITTLLLREEARYGRIDLRAFWVRRILRIWPLYYLTVALVFLVIPWLVGEARGADYARRLQAHLPAFLAFLGNWSMVWRGPAGGDTVTILWSVCVEEQFYVVCPLLLVLVRPSWRATAVAGLIAAAVGYRHHLARSGVGGLPFQFNSFVHADTLLSGVLLAIVLHRHPPGRGVVRALGLLQWPLYAAAVWLFGRPHLAHGAPARMTWDFVGIWAIGLGLIAVAVLRDGWLRAALGYARLVWLGKISYGLYMYHEIALWLGQQLDRWLGWFPNKEALMTIATFALTVALAAASYYGYERRFLQLKGRWTRVPSRPV